MEYSLRELECFRAVAEELSFTRAARRLHLAQPPLSRHIRTLEEKIGAQLFNRADRKVAITPAGRIFQEESHGILAQLIRAGEAARRSAEGESARLRLGFVSAVLGPEIADILRRYREAHPSIQVMLHDLPPAEQQQLITEGRMDAGFVGLIPPEKPPGMKFVPWRQERLLVFVPSGHKFAPRPSLALGELRTEGLVAVSGEAAPAFSTLILGLCRKAGFRPRIVLESARAQAVAVMVAAGSGLAILPESLAAYTGSSIVGVPIKGSPSITHVFALSSKKPPPAMAAFLEILARTKHRPKT